jgi:hypothetical protein
MNSIARTRRRIEPALEAAGFWFGVESSVAQEAHFYRPARADGLYELVHLCFAGKSREAVVGWIGISAPRIVISFGGLTEERVLMELATDFERGLAVVETAQDLGEWERRFMDVALREVVPFAKEKANQVLAQTSDARATAKEMLRMVDMTEAWEAGAERLRREASDVENADVERVLDGQIVNISDTQDAYRIACFSLQRVRGTLIGPLSRDRAEFRRIAWPIQIVADELIAYAIEHGLRGHER